jgi:hypothetical protein
LPLLNHVIEPDMPLFEKIEKFTGHYIDMAMKNPYLTMFVLNGRGIKCPSRF